MNEKDAYKLSGQLAALLPVPGLSTERLSGMSLLQAFSAIASLSEQSGKLAAVDLTGDDKLKEILSPPAQVPGKSDAPRPAKESDPHEVLNEWEARLSKDAALTDKVLDRVIGRSSPTSAPLQQSLRLVCAAGGTTGGRFVVKNTTRTEAELTFKCEFGEAARELLDNPKCAFTPDEITLEPAAAATLRLDLDFSRCAPQTGVFEFAVEAVTQEDVLMRMWVDVEIVE